MQGDQVRILRLTPHYYFDSGKWPSHFDPIGGMQNQITVLSEWMARRGVAQDVLTTGMPGVDRQINKENLTIHSVRKLTTGLKSKYTGTVLLDESWALGVLLWCLKKKKNHHFDLIHVHTSGVAAPLYIALIAKSIMRIPLVLTIHCTRNLTYEPMHLLDDKIHSFVKKLEIKAVGTADQVIFLTEKTKTSFSKILPDSSNKYLEVQDVISQHHLHFQQNPDKRKLFSSYGFDLQENDRIIIFIGRIAHEKGWKMFVEICEALSQSVDNVKYVIVGDGPQYDDMLKQLTEKRLFSRTLVTGFIAASKVPEFLHCADVLVIPSIHEELGGVSIEGVQAKVPIVASDVGGLSVTFHHGETAMLSPFDDKDTFVRHILTLLRHPEQRKQLAETARNRLESVYQPDLQLEKILHVYKQLSNKKENQEWMI